MDQQEFTMGYFQLVTKKPLISILHTVSMGIWKSDRFPQLISLFLNETYRSFL